MRALDFDYMFGLVPILLSYEPLTLGMAAISMVMALVLASHMAVVREVQKKLPGCSEDDAAFALMDANDDVAAALKELKKDPKYAA